MNSIFFSIIKIDKPPPPLPPFPFKIQNRCFVSKKNVIPLSHLKPWYPSTQDRQCPLALSHASPLMQFPVHIYWQFCPYSPSSQAKIEQQKRQLKHTYSMQSHQPQFYTWGFKRSILYQYEIIFITSKCLVSQKAFMPFKKSNELQQNTKISRTHVYISIGIYFYLNQLSPKKI